MWMKCKSCSKPVYHGIDAIIGNETVCISDCLPMYEKALSSSKIKAKTKGKKLPVSYKEFYEEDK